MATGEDNTTTNPSDTELDRAKKTLVPDDGGLDRSGDTDNADNSEDLLDQAGEDGED